MAETGRFEPNIQPANRGLLHFFLLVLGLAAISTLLAFLPVSPAILPAAVLIVSALFIATPVYAIFRAASHPWTPKMAVLFTAVGAAMHVGLHAASVAAHGVGASVFGALSQTGLMGWCVGLGALLAALLKEKNLLIPVSLFLAAFDIFLVLTPLGPTQTILKAAPQVLSNVGYHVPRVQEHPTFGPVPATFYIGPADFVFMAMFFAAIFRFQMRAQATLLWLAPTLIAYMVLVTFVGPLPALVPIGLCVLAVNFKEFKLSKEEWASTGLVVVLCTALIAWGMTRPKPPSEPLQQEPSQGAPAPAGSRAQGPE